MHPLWTSSCPLLPASPVYERFITTFSSQSFSLSSRRTVTHFKKRESEEVILKGNYKWAELRTWRDGSSCQVVFESGKWPCCLEYFERMCESGWLLWDVMFKRKRFGIRLGFESGFSHLQSTGTWPNNSSSLTFSFFPYKIGVIIPTP